MKFFVDTAEVTEIKSLAEAGLVFAPPGELGWAERVRRLIGPSPQADWTVERLAAAFSTSASTLQRRLAQEGRLKLGYRSVSLLAPRQLPSG